MEVEGREVRRGAAPAAEQTWVPDQADPGPPSLPQPPAPLAHPVVLAPSGWPPASLTGPLPPRGLEAPPRGWSVSLHSRDAWQDLAGCDFVLDLISQTEDLGDPACPRSYPITPFGS